VAVKKLIQQHFSPEQMKDFLDEINMMKCVATSPTPIKLTLTTGNPAHARYALTESCTIPT
jgi:hypothetical protein